jgi:hypothetical protein
VSVCVPVVVGTYLNQMSWLLFQLRYVPRHMDSSGSGVLGVASVVSKEFAPSIAING